jgi:hypothetical protein
MVEERDERITASLALESTLSWALWSPCSDQG